MLKFALGQTCAIDRIRVQSIALVHKLLSAASQGRSIVVALRSNAYAFDRKWSVIDRSTRGLPFSSTICTSAQNLQFSLSNL
jgi:hypothetical protein